MRAPLRLLALAVVGLASTAALASPAAASREAPTVQGHTNTQLTADTCKSYAGVRMTRPGFPVFIVDEDGYRRGINSAATYDRLFSTWDGIRTDIPLEVCPERAPLSDDAELIRADGYPVFLYTNGERHGINSAEAFNKYHFAWDKIHVVSEAVLRHIPEGAIWA